MTLSLRMSIVAVLLAASCCLCRPATASLSIRAEAPTAGNTHWDLYLKGEIEIGAAERVRRQLIQVGRDGVDVYFDSTGGSLIDGINIGRALRKLGASTTVGMRDGDGIRPGKCFSACALAFLGGVHRYVPSGSLYGVQRVSTAVRSPQDFDVGQMVTAQVAGYIREMGVDGRLFERMASAGANRIYVLQPAELRTLHVVNEGRQPAEWWSELSARGPSLTGSQRKAGADNKVTLACKDGVLVLTLVYREGDSIAGDGTDMLLIDGTALPLSAPVESSEMNGYVSTTFDLSANLARRLIGAATLGHATRAPGAATATIDSAIDVDAAAAGKIKALIDDCIAPH